jgi:ABC-type lipoprotein export system ATPase subunit
VTEPPLTYELEAANRAYGEGSTLVTALDSLDLTIRSGEFVAILGPSGSGKTTLLQLLGALDRPSAGTVRFEGRRLDGLGDAALADLRLSAIGFVFQQFNLIPTLTATGNVEAGLAPLRMNGVKRSDAPPSTSRRSGSRREPIICRRNSPEASSNGSRSPARSLARRGWSSPTSPPATSTPRAARW